MYSLAFLIVELESARRRLLYVFEVPDANPTKGSFALAAFEDEVREHTNMQIIPEPRQCYFASLMGASSAELLTQCWCFQS
jgi:hypothetical protein